MAGIAAVVVVSPTDTEETEALAGDSSVTSRSTWGLPRDVRNRVRYLNVVRLETADVREQPTNGGRRSVSCISFAIYLEMTLDYVI